MPKLRVHNFSMSVDGYVAGPDQGMENPLGVGGMRLHDWVFATPTGRRMLGQDAGDAREGLDDVFLKRGEEGIGATVMGRNMFGPIRGAWTGGDEWKGWWGPNPPYHHPVFVLTHHPRAPITMQGGTTFQFVTGGIELALKRAFEAANGADVRLGGGASAVQQYLRASLVDELHIAMVPILLGDGERLFANLDGGPEGYECVEFAHSPGVTHVRFVRNAD